MSSAARLECLAALEGKNSALKVQSDDQTGASVTSEVLSFVDDSVGDVEQVQYVPNPIASADSTANTDLAKFLSRPTLIDARAWATGGSVGYLGSTIEPWHLYLSNAVILRKLQNFAFLRAKLCVKFVINATPFHFGLLRVAYEPNTNAANTGTRSSVIRSNPTTDTTLLVPLSQLPGVWLHPSDNSGGHLELPFFLESNWLNLSSATGAKTMGTLKYFIAAILGAASATASSSITIDTFAWLEDVELSASTNELTLQGKTEYDGPVSTVASSIASISRSLESAPVIGKFARATTIGASAVANIASMFGYTNTPVISSHMPITSLTGPVLATSEISTPVQKLALDPRQELSIDPTLHGISNEDEMVISTILQKESILTPIGWNTTDAVGTVIFNARVSPMLFGKIDIFDSGSVFRASRVYHTPMSYLGMMFQHWRGDVIFDFEVICTKFHKGRLKLSWDPLGSSGTVALPENVVYTTILDIGENNRASIRVPYHTALSFLRLRTFAADNWTPGSSNPVNPINDNGLLVVSVLTPLVSPVTPQNLAIMVRVRGGDNLELANLRSTLASTESLPPPSFFAVQGKDEVEIEVSEETFGDKGSIHPQRYALNFGECISSLRTVAHRMSLYDVTNCPEDASLRYIMYQKSYSRLPPMYGWDPNGICVANKVMSAGTGKFNYVPTHPMTYIAMMYGAFRGGVNYTANPGADLYPYIGDIRVQRHTTTTLPSSRRGVVLSTATSALSNSEYARFLNSGVALTGGGAFTNSQTNGSISWNAPQLSGVNFNYTDPTYAMLGNASDQTNLECTTLDVLMKQASANTTTRHFSLATFAGSGVDWHCLWWLCCPTLDYYDSNPTSA